jgi:transposase
MQDKDLYEQILGIQKPWHVDGVDLRLEPGEVHIYLSHDEQANWKCPECDQECSLYDHQEERQWRHLDTCQYKTILHAHPPRSNCKEHGVKVVKLPWAEPGSRFTMLFERLAIDWLKAASQKSVASLLNLSWDEIHGLMERAVKRGLARRESEELIYIGVDEKSFTKGHEYMTLVNDLVEGKVLFVCEGRKQSSLDEFWATVTEEQKEDIQGIAVDMWDPYIASIRNHLYEAEKKIVFDKFHIASHLGEAVDKVRRQERKLHLQTDDRRLVGSKHKWLRNPDNFSRSDWLKFKPLRESKLKTARAWAIKEAGMSLFSYRYEGAAKRHFKWWYNWAAHCRLDPVIRVAKMLKSRLTNILTYLKHPITNAMSESLNAKIQWVKYTARGFRNKVNFKTAIYFHCGKLDMVPRATH